MSNKCILKEFNKYVILNILAQMAFGFYTMTDTFFVARACGNDSLTALNIAFPMFCLINATGIMLGIAGSLKYVSVKNNKEDGNKVFTQNFIYGIIVSIIFLIIGIFFSKPLIKLMGADETIFPLAHPYLKIMVLFAPAFVINNIIQTFIRNDGAPHIASNAMIIGSVSNIILDYIFIFPLNMGISGAIIATGLSPIISLALSSIFFIKKRNNFKFTSNFSLFNPRYLVNGITPFIVELSSGIIMFSFNIIILKTNGNIGVAVFGIVTVISLVVSAIMNGISLGAQPRLSLYYTKNDKDSTKKIYKYGLIYSIIISIILYGILVIFRKNIIDIFNIDKDNTLTNLTSLGFILYFLVIPFLGINLITSTYLNTTNNSKVATIITLLRSLIILLPMTILLGYIFKLKGIWLAYPLTELIVSLLIIITSKRFVKYNF